MFRQWRTTPSGAGSQQSRRNKRRFVPTLSGSASCLEDRVVPSGPGHVPQAVHPAVVHHRHTAGAAGQHGLTAAGTHAATHHGHTTTVLSHHGLAATGAPGAVWASTAPWSRSPATFSTTPTSHLATGTVSPDPDPALMGLLASSDFEHLTVAMRSPGRGGALSSSTTTQSSTTPTGATSTGTTMPSISAPAGPTTTMPASQPSIGTGGPPWWMG